VRERQHYAFEKEDNAPDQDSVIMTYRINSLLEMIPWLLSWGASAEALTPQKLREKIRQEAFKLVEMLT